MTVKKLIQILKKMPQNSTVAMTSHDNTELETQGNVNYIYDVNFDDVRKESPDRNTENDHGLHGNYVIFGN